MIAKNGTKENLKEDIKENKKEIIRIDKELEKSRILAEKNHEQTLEAIDNLKEKIISNINIQKENTDYRLNKIENGIKENNTRQNNYENKIIKIETEYKKTIDLIGTIWSNAKAITAIFLTIMGIIISIISMLLWK